MTLLEFITFCTLKDLVVDTFKIEAGWHSNIERKMNVTDVQSRWKIIISTEKYRAYIAYIILENGEWRLVSASVHVRHTQPTKIIVQVYVETIIDLILPH